MGSSSASHGLTLVIPTFNERENVEVLGQRLAAVHGILKVPLEILVVDDGSPDGTASRLERTAADLGLPLRVLRRDGTRSMGKAVLAGIEESRGDLVCVMDADLSHPPEFIPTLLSALDGADGVVASRYMPGGTIAEWSVGRRMISWGATALSRSLVRTSCRDPLSGFFLFRRGSLSDVAATGLGNKPLLEILAQKSLTLHEIPYAFRDRERGSSKLDMRGIADFALLLIRLAGQSVRRSPGAAGVDGGTSADARGP